MPKIIKPYEVEDHYKIPDEVYDIINELITKNYDMNTRNAMIRVNMVLDAIAENLGEPQKYYLKAIDAYKGDWVVSTTSSGWTFSVPTSSSYYDR